MAYFLPDCSVSITFPPTVQIDMIMNESSLFVFKLIFIYQNTSVVHITSKHMTEVLVTYVSFCLQQITFVVERRTWGVSLVKLSEAVEEFHALACPSSGNVNKND